MNKIATVFNNFRVVFAKGTVDVKESERWFEQAQSHIAALDEALRELYSGAEGLGLSRRGMVNSCEQLGEALSMLAACEESTTLLRTQSRLTDTTESVYKSDPYILLILALKDLFRELHDNWSEIRSAQHDLDHYLNDDAEPDWDQPSPIDQSLIKLDQLEQQFGTLRKEIRKVLQRFQGVVVPDCSRAMSTATLSNSDVKKIFKNFQVVFSEMAQGDHWFEQAQSQIAALDEVLRELYSGAEGLVGSRRDMTTSCEQLEKAPSVSAVWGEQADEDNDKFSESIYEYIKAISALKKAFAERVRASQQLQAAEQTLAHKLDMKTKIDSSSGGRSERSEQLWTEIEETIQKMDQLEQHFRELSKWIREEVARILALTVVSDDPSSSSNGCGALEPTCPNAEYDMPNHYSQINPEPVAHTFKVLIREFKKRGDGNNAYIVYKLETEVSVVVGNTKQHFETWRRYSDFLVLHGKIVENGLVKGRVIPIPPEKSTTNSDPPIRQLELYIGWLIQHPKIRENCDVRDFLEIVSDLPKTLKNTHTNSFADMLENDCDGISLGSEETPADTNNNYKNAQISPEPAAHTFKVRIREFEKRGDGLNAYLVYKLETEVAGVVGYTKQHYETWRRFSDFLGLRDKLVEKYLVKDVVILIPPEKSVGALTETKTSLNRARQLERSISRLIQHPRIRSDCVVRDFLTVKSDLPKAVQTDAEKDGQETTVQRSAVKKVMKKVRSAVEDSPFSMKKGSRFFKNADKSIAELQKTFRRMFKNGNSEEVAKALATFVGTRDAATLFSWLPASVELTNELTNLVLTAASHADFLFWKLDMVISTQKCLWEEWCACRQKIDKHGYVLYEELRNNNNLWTSKCAEMNEELVALGSRMDTLRERFQGCSETIIEDMESFKADRKHEIETLIDYMESKIDTHTEPPQVQYQV